MDIAINTDNSTNSRKVFPAHEKGIFEVRVEVGNNIFRIFSFFDKGNVIVLGNGFQKKSQKTPKSEIEKALKIKEEYFNEKAKRK